MAVFLACAVMLTAGCESNSGEVASSLPAAVHEAMYDTSSASFIDFAAYGELPQLPIGIFDADSSSMVLLEACLKLDHFDNIHGDVESDGLPDFAGEHFQYYTAASDSNCFDSALFLMRNHSYSSEKERSKIIVAGGCPDSSDGMDDVMALAENPAGVKIISAVNAGVRAMFDSLAADRNSAFTMAVLCGSDSDAVSAYGESVRRIAGAGGYNQSIAIISGDESADGLVQIVNQLRSGSGSKAPLKVVVMNGMDEGFIETCRRLLDDYRNTFVNGTYPYRSILADDIVFVDPALCAAVECYRVLREDNNLALRTARQKVNYFYGF